MQTSGDIEELVARIREKAEREAEEIIERAEKVAARDVARVRDELRSKQSAAEDALTARLSAGREALRAESAIHERRRIMERQEQAIEAVFASALQELAKTQGGVEYGALLIKLVRESVAALGLSEVRVRLNAADREQAVRDGLFGEISGVKITVEDQPLDTVGGVVVSDESGRIFYDNTFEARLELRRAELRASLADKFGF